MNTNKEVEKTCCDIFDLFAKNNTPREIAALALTVTLTQLKQDGIIVEQYVAEKPKSNKQIH